MFKFTMDRKDADANPAKLAAAGIEVHHDMRISLNSVCFIVKGRSPKDLDAALEITQEVFYLLPVNVWIDGKKLDPFKDPNKFMKTGKIA